MSRLKLEVVVHFQVPVHITASYDQTAGVLRIKRHIGGNLFIVAAQHGVYFNICVTNHFVLLVPKPDNNFEITVCTSVSECDNILLKFIVGLGEAQTHEFRCSDFLTRKSTFAL